MERKEIDNIIIAFFASENIIIKPTDLTAEHYYEYIEMLYSNNRPAHEIEPFENIYSKLI